MRAKENRSRVGAVLLLLAGLGTLSAPDLQGQGLEPPVHAILFYSPTCPHCHTLINNHLVPLQEEYGSRLVILAFDVTQSWASEIYWEALRQYQVPQEDWVVPVMVLREEVLVGGDAIPIGLVEALESGEPIDLPNLPPLLTLLDEQGMLDPRYPERRIVRQGPPEGGNPDAQQDSVAGAPDPSVQADSTPVPEEVPDSSRSEDPAPETDERGPEGAAAVVADPNPVAGERTDPDSLEEEGARAVPDPGTPVDEEVGATPDQGAPARELEDPSETGVPPTVEGAAAVGPALDLSGAAEEMESMTMLDRFNQDRTGNALSVLVLLVMLVSLVLKIYPPRTRGDPWPPWVIPLLVVLGIGVAAYLSYIEVTHAEAACGPVGDCNTVNQSEYATLFGFLPVGVLGLLGYGSILFFWAVGRLSSERWNSQAHLALWGAAVFGTLFSVYLTFLEPFVIGATCAWCLSSALIMTLLLWASAPLAARGWPDPSPH